MKYGLSIALALLWFTFSTSYAQTHLTDWKNLNSKSTITCITHNTDYLYASTMVVGVGERIVNHLHWTSCLCAVFQPATLGIQISEFVFKIFGEQTLGVSCCAN